MSIFGVDKDRQVFERPPSALLSAPFEMTVTCTRYPFAVPCRNRIWVIVIYTGLEKIASAGHTWFACTRRRLVLNFQDNEISHEWDTCFGSYEPF